MLPVFSSRAFLAPMAGVSDPALRLICKEMGAGLVVTELTSIHAIIAKQKQLQAQNLKISEFIEYSNNERPLGVQLFGSEIESLEKAAKIVEPYFDIIDYNMGCPAPHITQQMAGGALLQNLGLTEKILKTLVKSVDKPVTLKIRAGVDDEYVFKDISYVTLTPRYENRRFGVYLPVSFNSKTKWNIGAALRMGPLVVGVQRVNTFNNATDLQNTSAYFSLLIRWKKKVPKPNFDFIKSPKNVL